MSQQIEEAVVVQLTVAQVHALTAILLPVENDLGRQWGNSAERQLAVVRGIKVQLEMGVGSFVERLGS